ncbi:MAG: NCS2 family permease [Wujia sp.]
MDKFFKISERGSSIRTEIFAGITTFFAMAYIVLVNPAQVAAGGAGGWLVAEGADAVTMGKIWNAVYIGSILVAVIGTLLMAFLADMPFAQACGMGLNSFFCTTFVSGAFFAGADVVTGYQSGLVIILLSGLVFLVLSITGLREYIAKAMPECLKKAIPAGIGLFIALIGFKNAEIVEANQYTFVQFFDFHGRITAEGVTALEAWRSIVPPIVAIIGVIIIAILSKKGVKSAVIIGILVDTVLYYVFMGQTPGFDISGISQSFKDFGEIGFLGVFNGDAWEAAFNSTYVGGVFSAIMLVIVFCLVDMFDTVGTLYGTASQAGMLDENGDPINLNKSMLCDSIGTVSGSILGTSTCTTFVESASGVGAGGRTGFTSLITAICFAVCLFLSPIADVIPSCATAPALIFVGVLMAKNFANVDMDDMLSAVPAFLAFIMMPLTYSISNGIGIGAIAYVLIALFTGKYTKKDIVVTVIAALFVLKFIFVTM